MARLNWDSVGSRTFEHGIDRGVLYVGSDNYGVSWNGLINVSSSTSTDAPTPYYIDGFKYYNEPSLQDYSATIEAYTYPDNFARCEGIYYNSNGLGFDTQGQERFGLSYRSMQGNDVDGPGSGYKIHLVYNATATPSDRDYGTTTEDPEASTFSWDITTSPVLIPGRRPTAHFILDSTEIKSDTLRAVEDILYGAVGTSPRLLSPTELIKMIDDWAGFRILPAPSGVALLTTIGADDLTGNTDDGLFKASSTTRLKTTSVPGLYTL